MYKKISVILCIFLLTITDTISSTHLYKLKSTDTVYSVAKDNGVTIDELWVLNSFLFPNKKSFIHVTTGNYIWLPRTIKLTDNKNAKPEVLDDYNYLSRGANFLTSGMSAKSAVSYYVRPYINNNVNGSAKKWLSQFGTARTSIALDDHSSVNGSVDVLIPLYKSPDWMLFTQDGWRHQNSRKTINIGVGSRWFSPSVLYGVNSFIDNDITGNNYRFGVGGEYWTPYIRLSANGYQRLNGWHQSRDFSYYDERPANGYDVIGNLILPVYPALGMKLKFEQYYGDSVALFGRNNRQSSPYASTVGINWSPVPLVSIGADWRHGEQGMHDANVNLSLNYRIGESWHKQINPATIAERKSMTESQNDLVERNNNIILDYHKQILITLELTHSVRGPSGSVQPLQTSVMAKNGLDTIEWSAPELIIKGGKIFADTHQNWQVKLPLYQSGGSNSYIIRGIAVDRRGNRSVEADTTATVLSPVIDAANSFCSVAPPTLPADGSSIATMSCNLNNEDNQPVSGLAPLIQVVISAVSDNTMGVKPEARKTTEVSKFTEDSNKLGHYNATVTAGTISQLETLLPSVAQVKLAPVTLTLVPRQISKANSHCQLSPKELNADGISTATMSCELNDDKNNAVGGMGTAIHVTVNPNDGTTVSPFSENQTGHYSATIKAGKVVGIKKLSPAVDNVTLNNVSLYLNEQQINVVNSQCKITPSSLLANGKSMAQLSCLVKDNNNHPVSGLASKISADTPTHLGSKVGQFSENNQMEGNYHATVTAGTTDGSETLSVTVRGVALNHVKLELSKQQVSVPNSTCNIKPAQLAADGNSSAIMTCELEDDDKAPISGLATGIHVTSTPDDGTIVGAFNEAPQKHGHYTATVTAGTVIGVKTLSPSANSIALSPVILTLAEPVVSSKRSSCSVAPSNLPADGSSMATMSCLLKNAAGLPIGGQKDKIQVLVNPLSDGCTVGRFTEGSSGSYSATVTAGTAAGNNTLSPTVGSVTLSDLSLTLTHIYHVTAITVEPDVSLVADGNAAYTYTATVKDEKDNLVVNQPVTMEWQKSDTSKGLVLTAQSPSTTSAVGTITATLTSTVVVNSVQVSAKTDQQSSSVDAERYVSFIPVGPIYDLALAVDRTSPQDEGQANMYTFTATVTKKSDGQPAENVPIVWSAVIPSALQGYPLGKDKHLHVSPTNQTNQNGKATYTLYSDQGGVDDLQVTATVKKANPSDPEISDPPSKQETVSITASERSGIHQDEVILTPYNNKGQRTASDAFIAKTSALQFSWKDMALLPNLEEDETGDENGNGKIEYLSDRPDILHGTPYTPSQVSYKPYYTIDENGATGRVNLKAKVHLKTGRYKLYVTPMTINVNIFPGPRQSALLPVTDPDSPTNGMYTFLNVSGGGNPVPLKFCVTGSDVKDNDIAPSLINLYTTSSSKYNLWAAGIFGNPDNNTDRNVGTSRDAYNNHVAQRAFQIFKQPSVGTNYTLMCTYNY